MPLYDFECLDCGLWMERSCKHQDRDKLTCTECESKNIEQRITGAPSVNFINTQDRLNASLKKRSQNDHKKHYDNRLEAAKEKYKKAF